MIYYIVHAYMHHIAFFHTSVNVPVTSKRIIMHFIIFFRCCSQQEFGQCLILQYRKIFSECRKRRRQIMMTIIKNLEQRKYILSRSAVSWSRSATSRNVQCTHEHHAERPYNNIFVIYDFFSLSQPRIRVCT